MARSFSNAKLLSALVVDGFSKHYYQVTQKPISLLSYFACFSLFGKKHRNEETEGFFFFLFLCFFEHPNRSEFLSYYHISTFGAQVIYERGDPLIKNIELIFIWWWFGTDVICGGFTRIASSVARSGNSGSSMVKKQGEEIVGSTEKVSVGPRPVTGYYRPENRVDEIDVAELRAIFLNNKN
ncbi:uncharacterized protein LOC136067931 [Quercus suber]|uniref:uncharacterized protein LOC136067931 n=1 Tax=Quercus suber TaxID=58331 RepID=UPI0032DFD72C